MTTSTLALARPTTVHARRAAAHASALLQLLVLLAAFGAVALAVVPALVGFKGETVLSGSMQPMLHVGDVAYVKKVPADTFRVGDVVTFRPPSLSGAVVTHRIVEIRGTGAAAVLTTKGDANPARDSFTTPARDVIGRYAFTVPKLGKVLSLLRSRTSYVRIGGLLFLLVVAHERRSLLADFRRRRSAHASS